MFSTFSADLVEKIGCHKFQQPYFGNHILGCLQDGFQQALAAPFQNCVALVACHLADLRNGQYIRVICQLLLVPFLGQQPFFARIVQLALQRCGRFLVFGVVVIPPAGRGVAHRVGLSAVEILGNIFLGDFIAARSLSVVFAGNKPALQEIKRSARSDMHLLHMVTGDYSKSPMFWCGNDMVITEASISESLDGCVF